MTTHQKPGRCSRLWTRLRDMRNSLEDHARRAKPTRAISAGPTGSISDGPPPNTLSRDPAVLVVGGGQAGLSIAACLTQLGIDALIVDREPRIGDNWRKRYHALVLHNQVHVNPCLTCPFRRRGRLTFPRTKLLAGLKPMPRAWS